jgi:hypothetical protein
MVKGDVQRRHLGRCRPLVEQFQKSPTRQTVRRKGGEPHVLRKEVGRLAPQTRDERDGDVAISLGKQEVRLLTDTPHAVDAA